MFTIESWLAYVVKEIMQRQLQVLDYAMEYLITLAAVATH